MALELYMVGVIVSDMGRAVELYLETREAPDAKYAEMIGFGYDAHCAPYDVTPDLRFAMVDDPDGNTILLSAAAAASG